MILKDILNIKKIKEENEILREHMSPEMEDVLDLHSKIKVLEEKYRKLNIEYSQKLENLENLKKQTIFFEDSLLFQDFGLYTPRYDFATADRYKLELEKVRTTQKDLIKHDLAISGTIHFTINGNRIQGSKLVSDMKKICLRCFNIECDEVISKVKYNNYEMSLKKIRTSAESIEKLGKSLLIYINPDYLNLKIEELHLAFEYRLKLQEEKEAQKEARAEMREAAKLQKEIEAQRKKIEKEQQHYEKAYEKILKQIEQNPNDPDLLIKKAALEETLSEINKSVQDLDYREANQKAGYVYIISNIGAFGENIYKIGMTRRLDPQDRIDELGDASVPFKFDVHAMIFSDDAPALENALHKAFDNKKVNMVNTRREFFNVTLDEIKQIVRKNFDKTVEFIDFPDAEQYRMSLEMKKNLSNMS